MSITYTWPKCLRSEIVAIAMNPHGVWWGYTGGRPVQKSDHFAPCVEGYVVFLECLDPTLLPTLDRDRWVDSLILKEGCEVEK
jgi:hypothetical protein